MSDLSSANRPPEAGFEIGVVTLGEFLSDARLGRKISAQQRLREIVDAARLADAAGLDVFGVGEHHALDFVVSAVPVVLAAIELLGTEVAPVVRRETARPPVTASD